MPADETLGQVPNQDALTEEAQERARFEMPTPSVTEVNGLGEITADEAGIGELNFESTGGSSPLDTPVFGQPNPMSKLFAPSLDEIDLEHETTIIGDTGDFDGEGSGPSGLLDFARKFLGTPYVWGGTSPTGFDCSGFTQYVFAHFGVKLPRISADQGRAGRAVADGDMRPGDLVFWDNSSRNVGADHVGIYLGNGLFINAPRPGGVIEISQLYGDYWARRVI